MTGKSVLSELTNHFIFMFRFTFAVFLLITSYVNSQIISGKVYDTESTVKGAKITNLRSGVSTRSDDKGDFQLKAKVSDTLVIESLFHHPLKTVVKSAFFEAVYVFELKKVLNELDEVLLSENNPKEKPFKEEEYNITLNEIIQEDIKKNPHLYKQNVPKYGLDFIQVIGMVAKLFKKKKTKEEVAANLTYDQLVKLFENHIFFNKNLLSNDLKIPENNHLLFLEFCEARGINQNLMKEQKRFDLLNVFVGYSQEFLFILEDFNSNKDD